ncbi:MAG: selenide, water dikinase SelD [Gammaproteobacteria bacterium]
MRSKSSIARYSLVLVGAGHSNIALIRRFAMDPLDGIRLVVINPESTAPYSGMLPGFLAGQYASGDLFIDIAALCTRAGARFIRGTLDRVDAASKTLTIRHQALPNSDLLTVGYDFAVLNTGAAPAESFPSSHHSCYYVKPIRNLLADLPRIDETMREANRSMVIVGGGAAGIELAFAFRARYGVNTRISLVSKRCINQDVALKGGASLIRKALSRKNISFLEEIEVTEASDDEVMLSDGSSLEADVVCMTTPVKPPAWIEISGLAGATKFLTVNTELQVEGCDGLYAAGDIINLPSFRGRSGVMAVRAGQYLAKSLWQKIRGRRTYPFQPQKHWLTLLNLGDGEAIGVKGSIAYRGRAVFKLKDRIDQKFISHFKPHITLSREEMHCEGCAAKLPGDTLTSAFGHHFEDGAITTDQHIARIRSIDALSYLIDDPYLAGALTMRHAVSDIWAMGATPTTALTLIAVERGLSNRLEATEFTQALAGLQDAAKAYGVEIVGGHSLSLKQPMMAVTIEGECKSPLKKAGTEPGDEIWLTGPIGSGVLFAALSSGLTVGASIDEWIGIALTSLYEASQIASQEGVHAMTDVTGYGVAGHLREMLSGSGLGVQWSDQIQAFQGVDQCINRGILSTSHPDNERYAAEVGVGAPSPLVFDPQTCGPLMIAAPAPVARNVVRKWVEIGLSPQRVGVVTT